MDVLTEITNSDKDLLLSGDCTIRTKVLVSDSQDNGPIGYEMEYDSENDSYRLYGKSTQETRSGKNLFDSEFRQGSNTSATVSNYIFSKNIINCEKKNTYIFSTNLDTTVYKYAIQTNTQEFPTYNAVSDNTGWQTTSTTKIETSIDGYLGILITKISGTDITPDEIKNVKFQIEKGSVATSYEPYGVMPSPNYPSEVKSISGRIKAILSNNKLATFDLQGNELCSNGDFNDELVVENGRAKIIKRLGESKNNIVSDVTNTYTNIKYFQIAKPTDYKNYAEYVMDYNLLFTHASATGSVKNWDSAENIGKIISGPSRNYFWIGFPLGTTLEQARELLSNNCLYYTLAKSYEIELPNYTQTDLMILTEENSVKNWSIADDRYVPDVGFIGQFVAREIDGEFRNITDDFNIENKHIQIQMGVSQLGSSATNWYSLGTFIVTKPTDDEVADNTKFNGYDLAIKFNIDFNPNFVNEDYPKSFNTLLNEQKYVTNGWLAGYTCSQVGIELATTDFIHNDFRVLSNQFTSGESCRDVMKYISQLAFGYCEVYWDDKCYIRNISTDYSSFDDYHKLNYDTYYDLDTQKNMYGPVNRLFCGLQDVEGQGATLVDITTIDQGETTINIYNNPLTMGTSLEISQQLQLEAIQGGNMLWGLKYRPIVSTETIGHPWFKAYEPIELSDMENKKSITYPFSHTIKYTGHIKSDISSEGETKAENTYGYKDNIARKINRIGINVDRANEKITIINQKITDIDGEISDIKGQMIEIGDVYTKAEIRDIVSGVGVDGTVVTSVETATTIFDINGMTIGRTDAQTKTNINANGMIISNANDNTELLKINNSGVYSENLTARTYLNFGGYGRFEEYEEYGQTRMGCFWVKGGSE